MPYRKILLVQITYKIIKIFPSSLVKIQSYCEKYIFTYVYNNKSQRMLKNILLLMLIIIILSAKEFTQQQRQILDNARAALNSHLYSGQRWGMQYHFYRPGLYKYGPNQWLWDSCFHMIAWSRLNITNSILDLRSMLSKQDKKGRIPQMIYWGKQTKRDAMMNNFFHSDPTQTDITQMPMTPLALKKIYEVTKDKNLFVQFLPKLIRYHEWWANQRQPDNDGLVVIIHPWQSGLDASPMYDQALKVQNDQPKLKELYSRFIELQLSYKLIYKWNQTQIISDKKHSTKSVFLDYFVIKQVGVNAIYTYGWKVLADLSQQLGNQQMAEKCIKNYKHFLKGLLSLYDQEKGRYISRYLDADEYKPANKNTVQVLFPLIVPDIPQDHKNKIIQMLKSEQHYKSDYPIPTVSRSDPAYKPIYTINLMWRGPSWAPPNYFILQALKNQKQFDLYKQIARKWVKGVIENGIWQMWNPQTGKPYGVKQLGMSTSIVDVIYTLKELA